MKMVRSLLLGAAFTLAGLSAASAQDYVLKMNAQSVNLIARGMMLLPFGEVQPLYEDLKRQVEAQNKSMAEAQAVAAGNPGGTSPAQPPAPVGVPTLPANPASEIKKDK